MRHTLPPLLLLPLLAAAPAQANPLRVASIDALRQAVWDAQPGQVIELAPGSYELAGRTLEMARPGTAQAPITLRARALGEVTLKVGMTEGFLVKAPYWHFENLVMAGACADDSACEHAFHLMGGAKGTVIRHNRLLDFNSAIKVNGEQGAWPDHGLAEGNEIRNQRARHTDRPVTGIDIVAASGWVVRGNLIADLVKDGGNRTSYAGFMKGGGEGGLFENNTVECAKAVPRQALGEARVGLSFGGGGTDDPYCRGGSCAFEHKGGVMRGNVVQGCSDVAVYLNKAPATRILGNTLGSGIDVRFPATTAAVCGNRIDGRVRERDGGRIDPACDPHDLAKR